VQDVRPEVEDQRKISGSHKIFMEKNAWRYLVLSTRESGNHPDPFLTKSATPPAGGECVRFFQQASQRG